MHKGRQFKWGGAAQATELSGSEALKLGSHPPAACASGGGAAATRLLAAATAFLLLWPLLLLASGLGQALVKAASVSQAAVLSRALLIANLRAVGAEGQGQMSASGMRHCCTCHSGSVCSSGWGRPSSHTPQPLPRPDQSSNVN